MCFLSPQEKGNIQTKVLTPTRSRENPEKLFMLFFVIPRFGVAMNMARNIRIKIWKRSGNTLETLAEQILKLLFLVQFRYLNRARKGPRNPSEICNYLGALVGLRTQTQNAAFFERKGPKR